ncbi:hypothetical protein LX81_03942 [Palleronia aestuarii]|uniref:Uncharacterized protein n=2 Tax=Palleronia aestuarii TaxID=568105 RepID=A0A2W7MUU3_9RHOB|nr:hypothetical protein LX81_03942 [Palleronia aestuarii]
MSLLAEEAGTLEAAGVRIEGIVGDLAARIDGPVPRELQELDLMVQTVRDLAAFFETLSGTVPDVGIDLAPALATLKLQRLREGLSGTGSPDSGLDEESILF